MWEFASTWVSQCKMESVCGRVYLYHLEESGSSKKLFPLYKNIFPIISRTWDERLLIKPNMSHQKDFITNGITWIIISLQLVERCQDKHQEQVTDPTETFQRADMRSWVPPYRKHNNGDKQASQM